MSSNDAKMLIILPIVVMLGLSKARKYFNNIQGKSKFCFAK